MDKKKILITGCYHSMNSGVMAMAESIIQQFSDDEIYVTTSRDYWEKDKERYSIYPNVKLVEADWLNGRSNLHKFKILAGFFGFSLFPRYSQISKQINQTIDISGDGISDDYGTKSIFFSLFPNYISKTKKHKFIYAPQTIGPFKKGMQTFLVKKAFKKADFVYLREEESLNKIDSRKFNIKAVYADLAFLLRPQEIEDAKKILPKTLAIGVSSLIKKFGKENTPQLFKEICEICLKNNYNVLLVNHVTTLQGDDVEISRNIKEKFYKNNERVLFFDKNFRGSEWKFLIGKCDGIISARMHPVVHALSQGIPALNLSYNHKSIGVVHNRFFPYGDNVSIHDENLMQKTTAFIQNISSLDKVEFDEKVKSNRQLAQQFIETLN